ncbi:polyamine ABC transporter substrate-binding protein [Amnibacterium kyonggiense]|uniref:Spermidine/putrescine transport system substrate-binding protein n=1 Tax=Amnibacterium kyonggiense TaxID=595671 RepID=A0A4R7FSM5_9MICO|nr:spermidine/putrescine ABC transporter substrate-binding protein [Amnibacterium kyonggiense]TDS80875.1 spermidine/putrescine transport system substrate-binding protein [Amnibacterium kyonggiense]
MPDRPLEILVPAIMKKELSRRVVLSGLVASGTAAALAACAPSTGGGGGASGGGALNLYTWGEYDDPKVLKDFAKTKGGATVKLGSYDSNEELIAKLSAAKGTSGYDIVVPTLSFVPQMVDLKLLQELDHDKLPNLKNVNPTYLDTAQDKGNKYSVPKALGVSGYVYDTTVIKRELTSWKDFFDAAQKEAAGKTSLLADPNEILWAYFFSIGEDINTNDSATLDKAKDYLVKNIAPNVQAFESYVSNTIAQNGRALAHSWNGDARQGIIGNSDQKRYKWVKPTEGAGQFLDNWSIPVGAKNVDAAHAFIDYVLDPAVSLKELEYIGYDTMVQGIQEKATDVELPELIFYTPEEQKNLVIDIVPKSQEQRVAIFNEIQAAAGS